MNALLREFHKELERSYPTFAGIFERDYSEFGEEWAESFARSVEGMFGAIGDPRWAEALRGYVLFSVDAMKNQKFFEKHGRYAASNYAEVKRECWDSPDFMLVNYLPGMFISYHLWPHHYRLLRFYRREVLPVVRDRRPNEFCEVGTGTAVYSAETLRALPHIRGVGFDISEHALTFGRRVILASGAAHRYRFEQRDILADPPAALDYLICQEVLEHLEDPAGFVWGLHRMVVPGGLAYITAAVTAGHSDHIYLFNDPAEVRRMLEEGGFSVLIERTEQTESANDLTRPPRVSCYLCVRS